MSFNTVIQTMLPSKNGTSPHITEVMVRIAQMVLMAVQTLTIKVGKQASI